MCVIVDVFSMLPARSFSQALIVTESAIWPFIVQMPSGGNTVGMGMLAQSQQAMTDAMMKAKRAAELQAQIQARLTGLAGMNFPGMPGMPLMGPVGGMVPPMPLLPGFGQQQQQQQQ